MWNRCKDDKGKQKAEEQVIHWYGQRIRGHTIQDMAYKKLTKAKAIKLVCYWIFQDTLHLGSLKKFLKMLFKNFLLSIPIQGMF